MLSTIKRVLGIAKLESRIVELEAENAALRDGRAVVTADGRVAIADAPKKTPLRPRAHSWYQLARKREAEAWRELCEEAFPNADATAKRSR